LEREIALAGKIQQALLPKRRHVGVGFEVVAASIPCRAIGGDFFDYFDRATEEFGFVLGDVAGKGPPAALLAAVLQGIFASHSSLCGTPADTLAHVNEVLIRRAVASRFATALYGLVSRSGGFTYSNAGHNPPILVGPRGVRRLRAGGLIIGAFEQATFDEETLQLETGDVLVVFSDGITEAFNSDGEEFGDDRLVSCVQASQALAPQALLEHVLDVVHQFTRGAEQSDDLTLLILKYADARIARAKTRPS
jgi:sigma-B regulation protein RsbU (phosphoserine phosphatase)